MQLGIDSFAAAFDDSSLAVSPQDRLRHLVEQIEHADQVGLDVISIQMNAASLPHAKLMKAIETIGTRVAPLVRDASKG
jgi:hypothetical protein